MKKEDPHWKLRWPSSKLGKYLKRRLSKYNRREAKLKIWHIAKGRGSSIISEVNWKGW